MRINGEWYLCDDGVVRPIVRGELLARDGSWLDVEFLLDIGAYRTVLVADLLRWLAPGGPIGQPLNGLGGTAASVNVATAIRLSTDQGNKIVLRGQFAAVTESAALDMCVLGRDITSMFAVIVDQPQNVICLLSQRHRYRIESV
jgi:hypothetical protein